MNMNAREKTVMELFKDVQEFVDKNEIEVDDCKSLHTLLRTFDINNLRTVKESDALNCSLNNFVYKASNYNDVMKRYDKCRNIIETFKEEIHFKIENL